MSLKDIVYISIPGIQFLEDCGNYSRKINDAIYQLVKDNCNEFHLRNLRSCRCLSREEKERETTINEKIIMFKKIDVPDDGSCLFWAVTMSYLLPVRNNKSLFSERFIRVFGEIDRNDIDHAQKLFDDANSYENVYEDEIIIELVSKVLRNRVVDEMMKQAGKLFQIVTLNDFLYMRNEAFITNGKFAENIRSAFPSKALKLDLSRLIPEKLNISLIDAMNEELDKVSNKVEIQKLKFRLYLDAMRDCRSWAGQREVRAIQTLLNCHITVYKNENPKQIMNLAGKNIFLFNHNDGHYKFSLIKAEIVMKSLKNKNHQLSIKYIDLGIDKINYRDNNGDSLLHFATMPGNRNDIINRLIWQGADKNIRNNKNQTPSDVALKIPLEKPKGVRTETHNVKKRNISKPLNRGKNDLRIKSNENSYRMLHVAAVRGEVGKLRNTLATSIYDPLMTLRVDDKGSAALYLAVVDGYLKNVEYLIANGADVNANIDLHDKDKENSEFSNWNPLHYAAAKGDFEIVKSLIEKGKAEVDIKDYNGGTALQIAVKYGRLKVVKYLIEKGADINSVDKALVSVLSEAARTGHAPIVHYLIESGAEVDSVDQRGMTPLHHAVKCQRWNVVHCLVEYKADVNATDKNNETPLIIAVNVGELTIVKYLLQHGAELTGLGDTERKSLFSHFIFEIDLQKQLYQAIHLGNVEILVALINNNIDLSDETLDEILATVYDKITTSNLALNEQMRVFVLSKLLKMRFFSNNRAKAKQSSEVKALIDVKRRIELVLAIIHEMTFHQKEKKSNDIFIYLAKQLVCHLQILKRQLSWSYDLLPWEEMQFYLATSIAYYINMMNGEIISELIMNGQKLMQYLLVFKTKLRELDSCEIEKSLNLKKKIGREDAVEKIIKTSPEFVDLYKDFEIMKDGYSLQRIEKHLKIACSVHLKDKPAIGQLAIERALQVIGECMKNTIDSPNMSESTQNMIIKQTPLNTMNSFTSLRNLLSHVDTLTKKTEIEKKDPEFYVNIQEDLKKLEMEISLILFDKRIEAAIVLAKRILKCENYDEIRALTYDIQHNKYKTSLISANLHGNFYKIKALVKELDGLIVAKTEAQIKHFQNLRESMENYETKFKNTRNDYNDACSVYSLILFIETNNDYDSIKKRAIIFLNTVKKYTEINIYESVLDEVKRLFDVSNNYSDSVPVIERFTKLFFITDYICGRINHIDSFEFNFRKESDDQQIKEMVRDNNLCKIDNVLSSFIDRISNAEARKLFRKEYENRKEIYGGKLTLIHFYEKKEIKAGINSLNQFKTFCRMINLKLPKKETFESLFEETDESKIAKIVQRLNRINDSYGKLVKKVNAEPMNGFMQDAFINFIEFFEAAKTLDKDFIHEHKHLFFDSEVYFKKLKTLEDIFKGTKNDVDKVNLLKDNDDARVAVEMLMLTLTEILDNLDLLETNRLFLDQPSPLLIGKNLRNYLAHGDLVIDILSIDHLHSIVYHYNILKDNCNRETSNVYTNSNLIRKATVRDSSKLVDRYQSNLEFIIKQSYSLMAVTDSEATFFKDDFNDGIDINFGLSCGIALFQVAAARDHLQLFLHLLNENLNIYQTDIYGYSILHYLPPFGSKDILRFLIDTNYVDVDVSLDQGKTLLHLAAEYDQNEIAELLITNGVNVDAIDIEGFTPIQLAALNGHQNVVRALLAAGADVNSRTKDQDTLLHCAVKGGLYDLVRFLIDNGSNVHDTNIISRTPLHEVCVTGDVNIGKVLLEGGANVNATAENGESPLHMAAANDHDRLIELLLAHGADLRAVFGNNNSTALHAAILHGSENAAWILINRGADIRAKAGSELTALDMASFTDNRKLVEAVLKNGARINDFAYGQNALHAAAYFNRDETLKTLIDHEANVNVRNKNGRTAWHLAARNGNVANIERLLASDASVNAVDNIGWRPLNYAVIGDQVDAVDFLIRNGALKEASDDEGRSPLYMACFVGSFKIFEKLKTEGAIAGKDKEGLTPFHIAVQMGHVKIVENLIECGVEIDGEDNKGEIALHMAARKGHIDIIKLLLKHKSRIDKRDKLGQTALHFASFKDHYRLVQSLLRHDAPIDSVDANGRTALYWASALGHIDTVRILLKSRANVELKTADNDRALDTAANNDHLEIVRMLCDAGAIVNHEGHALLHSVAEDNKIDLANILIEKGADVNAARKNCGSTPLHLAANNGHFDMVKLLVEAGTNVNCLDREATSPLHIGAQCSHCDIIKLLLKNKADVNAKASGGYTALHYAVSSNSVECVKALVESDADANVKNDDEHSPLLLCRDEMHVEIAKILIENGADLNAANEVGVTPLHNAASEGHFDIAEVLVKAGAMVNRRNKLSQTPLHYATFNGHSDIIELLLTHKVDNNCANVNAKDDNGRTPLHFAAEKNELDIADVLIQNGADVNAVGLDKGTPLHLATAHSNREMIKLLLNSKAEINAKCIGGYTALHLAVISQNIDCVETILTFNPNVDAVDDDQNSPLRLVLKSGHIDIIKVLIRRGADVLARTDHSSILHLSTANNDVFKLVLDRILERLSGDEDRSREALNARDELGNTPLMWAVYRGNVFATRALLACRYVDINKQNLKGWTALHVSALLGHADLTEMLLGHGADVFAKNEHESVLHLSVSNVEVLSLVLTEIRNQCEGDADRLRAALNAHDTEGDTPLMWTVENKLLSAAELLLECDEIDINSQNLNGWTALHWAAHKGHLDVVSLLVEKMADANIKDKDGKTAFYLASCKMNEDGIYETIAAILLSVTDNTQIT